MSSRPVGRRVRCSLKLLATPSKLRVRFEDLLAVFHLRTSVFIPVKGLAALMHVRDAAGRGLSSSRDASAFAFFCFSLLRQRLLRMSFLLCWSCCCCCFYKNGSSSLISFRADDLRSLSPSAHPVAARHRTLNIKHVCINAGNTYTWGHRASRQTNKWRLYATHASIRPTHECLEPLVLIAVIMCMCIRCTLNVWLEMYAWSCEKRWTRHKNDDEVVSDWEADLMIHTCKV